MFDLFQRRIGVERTQKRIAYAKVVLMSDRRDDAYSVRGFLLAAEVRIVKVARDISVTIRYRVR